MTSSPIVTLPPRADGPTLSCVICFYNEEKYLAQAIESVFRQSFGDWELILIDDGSRDRSVEVAQAAAERHPGRVSYHRHAGGANRGQPASRNLGVRLARGRYVCFLDADDLMLPGKFEAQVKILDSQPDAGAVINPITVLHPDGSLEPEPMSYAPGLLPVGGLIAGMLQDDRNIPHLASLFRRDNFSARPAIDDEYMDPKFQKMLYDDAMLFSNINLHRPVFFDPNSYYLYRKHPQSLTRRVSRREYRAMELEFLHWVARRLDERGLMDSLGPARTSLEHRASTLEAGRFSCALLPSAVRGATAGGARISAGEAGHLVYGPYLEIEREGRYGAVLEYSAAAAPEERVGVFEVVASVLDEAGTQGYFQALARADLFGTADRARQTTVEFSTRGAVGALLEARVHVEAGVILKATSIRTWLAEDQGPSGSAFDAR